jgi:hypothetical protein
LSYLKHSRQPILQQDQVEPIGSDGSSSLPGTEPRNG